jgi:hypothetical protein
MQNANLLSQSLYRYGNPIKETTQNQTDSCSFNELRKSAVKTRCSKRANDTITNYKTKTI